MSRIVVEIHEVPRHPSGFLCFGRAIGSSRAEDVAADPAMDVTFIHA